MRNAWQLRVGCLPLGIGRKYVYVPLCVSLHIFAGKALALSVNAAGLISCKAKTAAGNLNVPDERSSTVTTIARSKGSREQGGTAKTAPAWPPCKFESCRYTSSIWHLFIHALHIRIRSDRTEQIS